MFIAYIKYTPLNIGNALSPRLRPGSVSCRRHYRAFFVPFVDIAFHHDENAYLMKTKILLTLCCALLAACATAPAPGPTPDPLEKPVPETVFRLAPGGIETLLAYHQWLRELAPAELAKELVALNAQPANAQFALKKSMLLSLSHNGDDLARAQTLIDGVLKSTEPDALVAKPLAQMLAANYAEMRRLSDLADRLSQQIKESQRRTEQLNQTLEALKAIERTLPARPNGAPATKGTP